MMTDPHVSAFVSDGGGESTGDQRDHCVLVDGASFKAGSCSRRFLPSPVDVTARPDTTLSSQ